MNSAYFKTYIRNGVHPADFNAICLELFHYQSEKNPVYREFISRLRIDPSSIKSPDQIPFLPISFFKTHQLVTGDASPKEIFTSSGTTGSINSTHYVSDPELYLENSVRNFTQFYGAPSGYEFLALLPGYSERTGSSLVKMVDHFIQLSGGGFYLNNHDELILKLRNKCSRQVILLGVTFALLDLAEHLQKNKISLNAPLVMETGGMKGRKKEMIREEVHKILTGSFHCEKIHSEYGMTELFSQAYSKGNGLFHCPDSMKILIRNITDPFEILPSLKSGAINIIDLANIDSIAFIATDDIGKMHPDGSFEVLGRADQSDVRGCNLMVV